MSKKLLQECIKRVLYLEKLCNNTTSQKREIIEETIDALNSMIEMYFPPKENFGSPKNILLNEARYLKINQRMLDLIRPLAITEPIILDKDPGESFIPKKDLFPLLHDFFRETLDDEMFQVFMYIYHNRNYFFHYLNQDSPESDTEIFLKYYQEPHIFIRSNTSVKGASVFAHEIGHAIAELSNPTYNGTLSIFSETVSIFFEFLFIDYLKSMPEFNANATDRLQYLFDKYSDDALVILFQKKLIEKCITTSDKKIPVKKAIEDLRRKNDDEDIDSIFTSGALLSNFSSKNLIYIIGKSVEIQLFILYHSDKEYAKNLLNKLIALNWSKNNGAFKSDLFDLGLKPTEKSMKRYKKLIMKSKSSNF